MKNISVKTFLICGAAIFVLGAAAGLYIAKHGVSEPVVTATAPIVTTTAAEIVTEDTTLASLMPTEAANVEFNISKGAQWEADGKKVAQYDVVIKNTGSEITDWQAVITFDADFELGQAWSGVYAADGKALKVTAVDYNKVIPAGGEINFGFQISSASEPSAEPDAKLYSGGSLVNTAGNPLQAGGKVGSELTEVITAQPKQQAAPENGTPVQINGKLSVKGTQIVNQNGQPFVIKGVSTHGIAWFPQYINKDTFRSIRSTFGANTIRLALYSSSGEGYTKELHKKVDEGVQYASELGMYVVIDWHILGNGNPNTDKAAAESFFKEMTAKYKDYNNVIYEICNEPNGDVQWARDIKPYAESMVKLIRSVDNDAIIIIGTPTWSQDVDIAAQSPVQGSNLVYAFHFYAATHKAQFRDKVSAALNAGLPVIVSEFGISDASGNGTLDEAEGNAWMQFLDERNIGRICWSISNKNEACALLTPDNPKTSGWSDSDLSGQGKWLKNAYNK